MKHTKRILITLLLFISIGHTQSTTYTWTGGTSTNFSDYKNWGQSSSFSILSTDEFVINKSSSTTVTLDANITIKRLEIKGGCIFKLNGKKLTTQSLQLGSGSAVETSGTGSEILYSNANGGELRFIDYTAGVTINSVLWPNNKTCPNQLTIRNAKVVLNTDVTVNRLHMWTSSTAMGYLILNEHNLTVKKYNVSNDNTGFIIPNSSSNLIFNNLTATPGNVRFADASKTAITSGIQLKSIQKTGTDAQIVTIIGSLELSEKLTCESGTLSITGSITLLSDATKTAYVAESAGSISATGGFNVQQYIPGRRVFRFLAHPFSSAIALSQLTDEIDITGTGGTSNGFTATINNNPSAYYFDVAAANNTSSGLNPGWTDFANTTSNSWAKASPALIYIRGAKGEGIDGNAYTPSAVTLDMSGSINTGTQTITLTKGSNSTFVTVGNPYPSPIQMQSITSAKRNNVSSTYWVFDANLGANGGYVSKLWDTDSYVLPAYAGFATEVSATGSITFEESHKTTATPADIFLGGNNLSDLVLNVFVNDRLYDLTRLITHDQAQSDKDYFDGGKMENADINFFTLSKNGEQLSIDARPFDLNTERIAMGLFSSSNRTIKIQADPSAFLNEHSVTLIDHYTNKQYNLNEGESAELSIDLKQSKSYGTQRLELVIGQIQSHTEKLNQAQVTIYPNPSESKKTVNVQANSPIQHIAVMDVSGRLVWEISPENKSEFMEIPETALANAGIYFIEITTALGTSSQKHVVQN
jgi:hypothetical protein